MNSPEEYLPRPENIQRIALVGAGTIGSGWAVEFLSKGFHISVSDPSDGAEDRLRMTVESALPLRVADKEEARACIERLTFCSSAAAAAEHAQFVQESAPEIENLKDSVIAEISEATAEDVVIASSTSGITPSRLQRQCRYPERFVVGHPFNPVYLVPLVEVVGGKKTDPATASWAMSFYQHIGKTALHCRKELAGHIANRLQDAVLNEALNLITSGAATPADIDAAITAGPGRRWSLFGPMMTMRLAAGSDGLDDVLNGKFGWHAHEDVKDNLTQAEIANIVAQNDDQTAGRENQDIKNIRDQYLARIDAMLSELAEQQGLKDGSFER